jgi:hypothetical protein
MAKADEFEPYDIEIYENLDRNLLFSTALEYKPLDNAHRQLLYACSNSFTFFYQQMGYTPAEFHLEWYEFFMKNYDTVVAAPRNHGKSVWTMLIIAWIMLFPEKWRQYHSMTHGFLKVTYATATKEIGRGWMKDFHEELENCINKLGLGNQARPLIQNTEEVELPNKSKVKMLAVMGSVRGVRSHFLFCDDLQKDKGQIVKDVIHHFESAIRPTKYPVTHTMLMGTVKADNDVIMTMLRNEDYAGKLYQAVITTPTGERKALWEAQRPLSWLDNEKRKIMPDTFSREYMNLPVADEFALIKLAQMQACIDYKLSMSDAPTGACYVGVDLARGATKDSDYNVVVVIEVLPAGEYYGNIEPVFILRHLWIWHGTQVEQFLHPVTNKWEDEPFYWEVLRELRRVYLKFDPVKIFVESNGYQGVIAAMGHDPNLLGDVYLPTVESPTTKKKHHDQLGMPVLRTAIYSRRFIFPMKTREDKEKSEGLMDELQKWFRDPIDGKYKCTAANDDRSMGTYIVVKDTMEMTGITFEVDTVANPLLAGREVLPRKEEMTEEEIEEMEEKKRKQEEGIYIEKHDIGGRRRSGDWQSRVG